MKVEKEEGCKTRVLTKKSSRCGGAELRFPSLSRTLLLLIRLLTGLTLPHHTFPNRCSNSEVMFRLRRTELRTAKGLLYSCLEIRSYTEF